MKNSNTKIKLVARVMLLIFLLASAVSLGACEWFEAYYKKDKATIINEMFSGTEYTNDKKGEFSADLYLQGSVSWAFALEIKVDDGHIYMNDMEYDDVTYVNNHKFTFNEDLSSINENNNDEDTQEILKKLNENRQWYILKTTNDKKIADKIAVCELNNTLYFVSISEDDVVVRVHKLSK